MRCVLVDLAIPREWVTTAAPVPGMCIPFHDFELKVAIRAEFMPHPGSTSRDSLALHFG